MDKKPTITRPHSGVYRIHTTAHNFDYEVRCADCEEFDGPLLYGSAYRSQHPIVPWFDFYLHAHTGRCDGPLQIHVTEHTF